MTLKRRLKALEACTAASDDGPRVLVVELIAARDGRPDMSVPVERLVFTLPASPRRRLGRASR